MSDRPKVLTLVGTRPELIKLSRVVPELDRHVHQVLVHTGQNYDPTLRDSFFEELGVRAPDYQLEVAAATPMESIANILTGVDSILDQEKPDAFLVYGDTNSCLSALAAKRRRVPVFHMEAGNRCFDQRVPEEINRKIIDHLADINMVHSEHARRYLLAEGLRPNTVFVTGSPMPEVIEHYRPLFENSDILERQSLTPNHYIVASVHREENVDDPSHLVRIVETLNALAATFDVKVLVTTHPRTGKRLRALSLDTPKANTGIEFSPPFGFGDWLKLQTQAFCVVSDSGTLTEEAAYLGFPAVMLREAHERPEGMDAGAVAVMGGVTSARVVQAVELVTSQKPVAERLSPLPVNLDFSRQTVRLILGHIDFVRRTVWQENL